MLVSVELEARGSEMDQDGRLDIRDELNGAANVLRAIAVSQNARAMDCLVRARVLEQIARCLPARADLIVIEGGR